MLLKDFSWCSGIEDTFIIERDPGTGRSLDEYELSGHYDHWREDIDAIASLGVDSIRWGLPWYRVEPAPGKWDWSWTDEVIERISRERGLELIADLVHYGTPAWMPDGLADPDYPRRVEEYAAAFAERYRGSVRWATPCNEPYTAALWSGKRGEWPPHLGSEEGLLRILAQATLGAAYSSAALASAGIRCAHVEVAGGARPERGSDDPELRAEAELECARQRLYWDLIFGLVDDGHPLRGHLESHGLGEEMISRIASVRAPVDIVGVNYYPQWSFLEYRRAPDGSIVSRELPSGTEGLEELCRDLASRYGKPLFITETSWRGDDGGKIEWMEASIASVRRLATEGLAIAGYAWFPAIEMIDWSWRSGASPRSDGRLHLGFWDLERRENPVADAYRKAIGGSR
jgi:beta-glucosidase/6-phospho-beta-glucosidase/beta-galactosidase